MKSNVTVLKDISYGEHERHKLDIYIPETPRITEGLVMIIHGGGWVGGDRSVHIPDAERWSEKGYICGIMNYRYVCKNINVFDELDDIASALKKAKEICAERGCKIKKVLLSGGSAGAHLSLLYAYTRAEDSPLMPVAVFCDCPPVDCSQPDFLMGLSGEFESWKYEVLSFCCSEKINKKTLSGERAQKALQKISPINYVSEKAVPTAVCHGLHDELVPYRQVLEFTDVLNNYNVRHDMLTFKNSGHALDKDPGTRAESWELMQRYIEKYL